MELGHRGRVVEMLGKECLEVMECREVGKWEKEWWMVVWKCKKVAGILGKEWWMVMGCKEAEILGKECLEVMGCKEAGK